MKLPENYQNLTFILLSHLQTQPAPHNNAVLRQQLGEKIKSEDIGELIAYALKQNLVYINFVDGNVGKMFIQKNIVKTSL